MATLPEQGGSEGTWGTELNTWLQVEHEADGTHGNDDLVASFNSKLIWSTESGLLVSHMSSMGGFLFKT